MSDSTANRKSWIVHETTAGLIETLESEAIPGWSSDRQLRNVAYELAGSIAKAEGAAWEDRLHDASLPAALVEAHQERLKAIVSAIPSAFHHYIFSDDKGKLVQPFELAPGDFLKVIESVEDESTAKLTSAYGRVWSHTRVWDEVQSGTKSSVHKDGYLHPNASAIEYVAQLYLESNDLVSTTLEWAVVDALIYWRILDFAAPRKSQGQLKSPAHGQLVDGPLLPRTSGDPIGAEVPSAMGAIRRTVFELVGRAVGETVALFATWWISNLVTHQSTDTWILFVGLSAARWIVTAIRGKSERERAQQAADEVNLQMFWDLCNAYERVPSMNVGLLRHLLYRLEERGAAFSPTVYAILDKKAQRESVG